MYSVQVCACKNANVKFLNYGSYQYQHACTIDYCNVRNSYMPLLGVHEMHD